MCGHSAVDASTDHRAPVSALKVTPHDLVESAIAQHKRLQLKTFSTEHINGFLVLVRKSESIIIPSEMMA